MLSENQVKNYYELGYVIVNFINKKKLDLVKQDLSSMIKESVKHNLPKYYKKNIKNLKNINFVLNDAMIKIESAHHKYLSNIYDVTAKSSSVMNLLCDQKILSAVNQLMKRKSNANLYLNSNAISMDIPNDKKYLYGWHRDNNVNIPGSNFIQLWMPLTGFLGKNLGGLKVLEKSQGKNLVTSETKNEQKILKKNLPMRTKYDAKVFKKELYTEKLVELYPGQALLFQNSLMHKGALNVLKNKVRYVVTCFYHDVKLLDIKFLNRDFKDKNVKSVYSNKAT